MKALLDLPAEIIQHVLFLLDPTSFYLCLLTSKLMRQHASQSKKLLWHHLEQIPGPRMEIRDTGEESSALMVKFGKRAAKYLYNGPSRMANVQAWKASPTMNKSLSRIVSWYKIHGCEQRSHDTGTDVSTSSPTATQNQSRIKRSRLLLEVHASIGIVNIRSLEGKKGANGDTDLLHVITPDFLGQSLQTDTAPGAEGCQVTRVAWQGACPLQSDMCESGPLLAILLAVPGRISSSMVLMVLRFDNAQFGPRVIAKYDVEAPGRAHTVTDLAIDAHGVPMIVWVHSKTAVFRFVAYKSFEDPFSNVHYLTEEATYKFGDTPKERVAYMHVLDDTVYFFPSSVQMPLWKGIRTTRGWTFTVESTDLPELHALWSSDAVCIPITHYHHHQIEQPDLYNGAPTCVNTALKLLVNRRTNGQRYALPSRRGAFILKSVQYPRRCKQYNPYAQNGQLEHIPVAYLADPPNLENLPSIGMKIALSPGRLRIALAAWRTVRIYSIDPLAFLSREYSYGFSKADALHINHDFAFVDQCGWSFYSNAVREGGCVVLEPIDLPSAGVIYALEWTSEDELWALTNEGVCRWDVGVCATGQSSVSELTADGGGLDLQRKH